MMAHRPSLAVMVHGRLLAAAQHKSADFNKVKAVRLFRLLPQLQGINLPASRISNHEKASINLGRYFIRLGRHLFDAGRERTNCQSWRWRAVEFASIHRHTDRA